MLKKNRYEVFSSLMIALVTIFSALTAWRASVASFQAGDADFNGLSAAITNQQEQILNSISAYEHYRAFITYYRYNNLGNEVSAGGSPENDFESSELWGMGLGLRYVFFPPKYLDKEGNFNLERELDELSAESTTREDVNPAPHFTRADLFRDKSTFLTGCLILFAISFFFFAFGQAFHNAFKYLFALLGVGAMLTAVALALLFEFSI